eukprot:COSAG06_NODE_549_length_14405_cov_6.391933_16_plen_116_part_00
MRYVFFFQDSLLAVVEKRNSSAQCVPRSLRLLVLQPVVTPLALKQAVSQPGSNCARRLCNFMSFSFIVSYGKHERGTPRHCALFAAAKSFAAIAADCSTLGTAAAATTLFWQLCS